MKLIYCTNCHDIVLLYSKYRSCLCGQSSGYYKDNINAVISGKAVPLGILNESFRYALENRPLAGNGREFTAFVIPHKCETVIKEK